MSLGAITFSCLKISACSAQTPPESKRALFNSSILTEFNPGILLSKVFQISSESLLLTILNIGEFAEVLEIIETPYVALNIFGQSLNQKRVHRVNFCRFTPGEAISMPYKNKKDCEDFQKLYENS